MDTNVFALCELQSVEWIEYAATPSENDRLNPITTDIHTRSYELTMLQRHAAHMKKQNMLCVVLEASARLWLLIVNEKYAVPAAESLHGLHVHSRGMWRQPTTDAMPSHVSSVLFRALNELLIAKVTSQAEFLMETSGIIVPNDATFIYRCPSLSQLNHFDVYLQESFPTPAFSLHFEILPPHALLCVNVCVQMYEKTPHDDVKLAESWRQMLQLPNNGAMVDVWHWDDALAARVVQETTFTDVYPRFRSITKRRLHHHNDAGDTGNENDDVNKKETGDDDHDDDEDEAAKDPEHENDAFMRRSNAKKKRKKSAAADSTENDESTAPVSPDTHVNSPEASGPTIRMTFPHDHDTELRPDRTVHAFKRKRTPGFEVQFAPLRDSTSSSSSKHVTPRNESTKTLSVAVSLVASLTQNEQQEALDETPTRTHPMLEALQLFVEKEMTSGPSVSIETTQKTMVNATAYVPNHPISTALSVNEATKDHLKRQLMTDQFKPWRLEYSPDLSKKTKRRQQKKELKRRLLLDFDYKQWQQAYGDKPVPRTLSDDAKTVRDLEIAIGLRLAVRDALVGWQISPVKHEKTPSWRDKKLLIDRVKPYLQVMNAFLKRKATSDNAISRTRTAWLSLEDYANGGKKGDSYYKHREICSSTVQFRVGTSEAVASASPSVVSEFHVRNLHPVTAPKPLDYVVVCPRSPIEWLGTLTLSYLDGFRSLYTQCHMGDWAPIDLSSICGNPSVAVDPSTSVLLPECSTSSVDAFNTFRSAGELLRPILSQGVKQKQAFARSAMANVVFLIAPFTRRDIQHKLWLLGAFGRGLFGFDDAINWKASVTIEVVYLDDLYDMSLTANPMGLMPQCMGLFNRVMEQVTLQPLSQSSTMQKQPAVHRFVAERLYHVVDWRLKQQAQAPAQPAQTQAQQQESMAQVIYGAYVFSSDRQWLWFSMVDAIGSMVEADVMAVNDLKASMMEMTRRFHAFSALFGDKVTLIITRLDHKTDDMEQWQDILKDAMWRPFASIVKRIALTTAELMEPKQVQLRSGGDDKSMLLYQDTDGFLLSPLNDRKRLQPQSRVITTTRSTEKTQEMTLLQLRVASEDDFNVNESENVSKNARMRETLSDFHALSYLTLHPTELQRQSPLPIHLAAIKQLKSEYEQLQQQLNN